MTLERMKWSARLAIALAIIALPGAAGAQARLVASQALPPLDGGQVIVKVVEITAAPGSSSAAHSHPCAGIGYIIEGAVRMQVKGFPDATYKAGESFYEAPNGVHLVSANASATAPARFTATFVCDREAPLSGPPVGGRSPDQHSPSLPKLDR
ncbi:MAG: cupin domain-containing protein [Gemmatimonadaceae bacterium]